jgi:hypothetical protein
VLTTISVNSARWTLVSGGIALLGSLATVIAEYAVKLPQDSKSSLFETYAWLVEARFEAGQMKGELSLLIEAGESEDHEVELVDLIGKSNVLCREAHRRLAILLSEA